MSRTLIGVALAFVLLVLAAAAVGQRRPWEPPEVKPPKPFRTTKQTLETKGEEVRAHAFEVVWAAKGATFTPEGGRAVSLDRLVGETIVGIDGAEIAGPVEVVARGGAALHFPAGARATLSALGDGAVLVELSKGSLHVRNARIRMRIDAPGEVTVSGRARFLNVKGEGESEGVEFERGSGSVDLTRALRFEILPGQPGHLPEAWITPVTQAEPPPSPTEPQ